MTTTCNLRGIMLHTSHSCNQVLATIGFEVGHASENHFGECHKLIQNCLLRIQETHTGLHLVFFRLIRVA